MISDRLRFVVITVVTVVWAANFLASLVPVLEYESDQAINGIFMVVVGALFAIGKKGEGTPPQGGGPPTPPPVTGGPPPPPAAEAAPAAPQLPAPGQTDVSPSARSVTGEAG